MKYLHRKLNNDFAIPAMVGGSTIVPVNERNALVFSRGVSISRYM